MYETQVMRREFLFNENRKLTTALRELRRLVVLQDRALLQMEKGWVSSIMYAADTSDGVLGLPYLYGDMLSHVRAKQNEVLYELDTM